MYFSKQLTKSSLAILENTVKQGSHFYYMAVKQLIILRTQIRDLKHISDIEKVQSLINHGALMVCLETFVGLHLQKEYSNTKQRTKTYL